MINDLPVNVYLILDLHSDEAYEKQELVMSSSFGLLKHLELPLSLRPLVVENGAWAAAFAAVAMA